MEINLTRQLLTLGIILILIFAAGCSQPVQENKPNSENGENSFELVRQAVSAYLNNGAVGAITPDELYREYFRNRNGQYILLDIRAKEDFTAANIQGSINIPYGETADLSKITNLPKDKKLIVIDYNGHWAAQTAASWNMIGLQAVPLLYGIQSWTTELGPAGYETFPQKSLSYPLVKDVPQAGNYALPELLFQGDTIEELARKTAASYLSRYNKGVITAEDLFQALEDGSAQEKYYLVDVRNPEHYSRGHIKHSINIPLAKLSEENSLKNLPPDQRIVLIGYDGMDASQGARALVTLGYDAVALKYGLSYWNEDKEITGADPIGNLVKDYYELTPLNYVEPSSGPASCG